MHCLILRKPGSTPPSADKQDALSVSTLRHAKNALVIFFSFPFHGFPKSHMKKLIECQHMKFVPTPSFPMSLILSPQSTVHQMGLRLQATEDNARSFYSLAKSGELCTGPQKESRPHESSFCTHALSLIASLAFCLGDPWPLKSMFVF